MRKVSEYRRHAAECRQMAVQLKDPTQKKQLEGMAETWDTLAEARKRQILKQADGDPVVAARIEEEERD